MRFGTLCEINNFQTLEKLAKFKEMMDEKRTEENIAHKIVENPKADMSALDLLEEEDFDDTQWSKNLFTF